MLLGKSGRGAGLKGRNVSSDLSWLGFGAACGKLEWGDGGRPGGPVMRAAVAVLLKPEVLGRLPAPALDSVDPGATAQERGGGCSEASLTLP